MKWPKEAEIITLLKTGKWGIGYLNGFGPISYWMQKGGLGSFAQNKDGMSMNTVMSRWPCRSKMFKIMIPERKIVAGEAIPKWYGIAYRNYLTDYVVCYPFPMNHVVAVLRSMWWQIRNVGTKNNCPNCANCYELKEHILYLETNIARLLTILRERQKYNPDKNV